MKSVVSDKFIPFEDVDSDAILNINAMEIEDKCEWDQEGQDSWTSTTHPACMVDLIPEEDSLSDEDEDETLYRDLFLLNSPEINNFSNETIHDDSDSET